MREEIREETALFISVVKWIIFATAVGIIVGLSTSLFLKLLTWSIGVTGRFSYFFILLPVALFISVVLVKYLAPDAEGHGTEKVIEAIHKTSGKIKAMVVPVKLVATIVTLAFGGSVGKEGPCAQIGAGLSSILADLLRMSDKDRRKLVICGISAGFASVFGTPIGGAIFGVEVLFVGSILYDVLLPSFIAGITSYQISTALGVSYFYHPVQFVPVFSESFFVKVILAGVFFGICSAIMIELLKLGGKLSGKIKIWPPLKGLIGGIILIPLVFIFSREYLGLGLRTIESALSGAGVAWYSFLAKSAFTSITLNFGGSGGIVTPIFFVGSTAGSWFGQIFHLDPATFAAIGMVSVPGRVRQYSDKREHYVGGTIWPNAGSLCDCLLCYQLSDDRSSQCLSVAGSVGQQIGLDRGRHGAGDGRSGAARADTGQKPSGHTQIFKKHDRENREILREEPGQIPE